MKHSRRRQPSTCGLLLEKGVCRSRIPCTDSFQRALTVETEMPAKCKDSGRRHGALIIAFPRYLFGTFGPCL